MTDRVRWYSLVAGCALLLGIAVQIPQWMHILNSEFRGVLVHLNSDEYQYLARLEEALTGRPEQAAQPYAGDPYAPGMHAALIEQAEGFLFRWTGWRAATVFQVMDFVVPFLLFLALVTFFRLAGFSRPRSLLGAALFCVPLFYSLNRPVHQRESFLLQLAAIIAVILAKDATRGKNSALWVMIGGALLGLLFGAYLWAWMFAWTYVGLLFLAEFSIWLRTRPRPSFAHSRAGIVAFVLGIGGVVALPFVIGTIRSMQHPLYAEMAFRQGMFFSRLPESWPYTVIFGVMSLILLSMYWQRTKQRTKNRALNTFNLYAVLFPVAVFIVINQQAIHGRVLAFTSHFTFAIALASVCAFLLSAKRSLSPLLISLGLSILMLAAIAWDNRPGWSRFIADPGNFGEQHFASLLPVLDAMPRTRILSDVTTSAFVAASTQHDIVSSIYLESSFMPSEEIAERWCLTVLPVDPEERSIADQRHLVWPDANAAGRGTDVREREVKMVEAACRRMDADPSAALRKYGVAFVLWDEARQPAWDLKRLGVPLSLAKEKKGSWMLYRLVSR